MEGLNSIQDLQSALKEGDRDLAAGILYESPELTNVCLIDEDQQETSTPLIEACRRGERNSNKSH